jgi:hypothetical protein
MSDIEIHMRLSPLSLERLDTLVRACRKARGPFSGLERAELLTLALELGLGQLEDQVLGVAASPPPPAAELTPPVQAAYVSGIRPAVDPEASPCAPTAAVDASGSRRG